MEVDVYEVHGERKEMKEEGVTAEKKVRMTEIL